MTTPFLDNFSGESTDVDLAAHVPSGGVAWTRVDGVANRAKVLAAGAALQNASSDAVGTLYVCDDQGSSNHYFQYSAIELDGFMPVVNRAVSGLSWIGVRIVSSKINIFKCVPGPTYTTLATGATTVVAGDTIRFESEGSTHRAYLNGALELTATDSHNSTVTRQGVVPRSSNAKTWLDNFEAGPLSAGPAPVSGSFSTSESGADAASVAGSVRASGALSAPEIGADAASISGAVRIAGALSASEAGVDSASIGGDASAAAFAAMSVSEQGADAAIIVGDVLVLGTLSAAETGTDSAAFTSDMLLPVSGAFAAAETGNDSAALTGALWIFGALAAAESGSDSAAFAQSAPRVIPAARRRYANTITERRPRNLN